MYSKKYKLHERENKHIPGTLDTIVLDVTNKCNMSCRHCYVQPFYNKPDINLNILKKALDEAYSMGVTHYILQGGEVCAAYDRTKAIIEMIHPDETYINMISNGWLMTREKIHELNQLQVDKIIFSLDSFDEEEHDKNRMPGSFKRVMQAIDDVLEEGMLTGVSYVITHDNLHSNDFDNIYNFCQKKGIRLDLQIAEPVGKWDGNSSCLIDEEDSRFLLDLYNKSPIMKNGQPMVKRDLYRGKCVECPAGTEFMALTADGNFMPCNFIQATLGNIKDKTLTEMRNDLLKSKWFSEKYDYCIVGECKKYFEEIVMKYKDNEKPLDAYEVFKL